VTTLFATGIAVVGTLLVITHLLSNKREKDAWDREVTREQVPYAEFFASLRKMGLRAYNHGMYLGEDTDEMLPQGWHTHTFERLQHLELYASPKVARLASEAYNATWRWGYHARLGQDDDRFYDNQNAVDVAEDALLKAIREDLRVPDRDGQPPGRGPS
jgi:hypothetical protein